MMMLLVAFLWAAGAAMAADVLIVDHPAYRSDPLAGPAVAEVVAGMPVVLRAGVVNVTPFGSSSSFTCMDPETVRVVYAIEGGEEKELKLHRESACQIDIAARLPQDLPLGLVQAWLTDAAGRKYGPARMAVVATRVGILNRLDQSWKRMPAAARLLQLGQPA
ncbi:MAG: hypothetical protein JNK48_27605, partial [Bryobacterales bacterium]|nr:hypothetical protein [Bryobacterales bacterium]